MILGSFYDYQIQLANALSLTEDVSILFELKKLEDPFSELIDEKVDYYLLGRGKPWYHPKGFKTLIDYIIIPRTMYY